MTIDLTGVAVSIVGGIFTILSTVALAWLQSHIKDKAAATTLSSAVENSLGAMQQASEMEAKKIPVVKLNIPGVPPEMAIGVQYVLNNAGPEAARLGVTPELIADKINAKIGLASISSNIAAAASPTPTPAPLAPVPVAVTEKAA